MRNYAGLSKDLADDLGSFEPQVAAHHSEKSDAAKASLSASFFKKLLPTHALSAEATDKSLEKFLAFNRSLPTEFVWESMNESEALFYDYFRFHLNGVFATETVDAMQYTDLADFIRFGPGSTQKADSRSQVTKACGSTATYYSWEAVELYRLILSDHGVWSDAEMRRAALYGWKEVQGGSLFFVPKSSSPLIARTCCTESFVEGILQQGIGGWVESRLLKYFGINLSTQPAKNRRLAWQGSRDSSYGTMDLSSASDSNGLSLFEKLVTNSPFKRAVLLSRSKYARLPSGQMEELRMVATMGNAFCFPVMTAILASAVRSVYDLMDLHTEFSVFGDDIVVDKQAFEFLARMLGKLGYVVNKDKSYNAGPFRESCGHDYYDGTFVRGVYIKSLETQGDVYSAINRLIRWSAYHEVPLTRTIRTLRSWARDMRVPPSEADDAGIKVPFKLSRPKLDNRYWFKYRYLKNRAKVMTVDEPDEAIDDYCFSGLYGVLSGVYKHNWTGILKPDGNISTFPGVSIRTLPGSRPRVTILMGSIPYWDYVPPDSEPGEAWLPDIPPKSLSKWDSDPSSALVREFYGTWEGAVVASMVD